VSVQHAFLDEIPLTRNGHFLVDHFLRAALAREHEVSRKFLYQQAHTAEAALTQAFGPDPKNQDVLFRLPVTKEKALNNFPIS